VSVSESTTTVAVAACGRTRGYVEIVSASLILGTSGALLQLSTMPASLLLVLRMALTGLVLAPWLGGALVIAAGRAEAEVPV